MSAPAPYGVARLERGPRRWAVTHNGRVLFVRRARSDADDEARALNAISQDPTPVDLSLS